MTHVVPDHYTDSDKILLWVEFFIEDVVEEKFLTAVPMKEVRRERLAYVKHKLFQSLSYGITEVGGHLVKKTRDARNNPHIFVGPLLRQRNEKANPLYRYETMFGAEKKTNRKYDPHWRDSVDFKFDTEAWGKNPAASPHQAVPLRLSREKLTVLPELDVGALSLDQVRVLLRELHQKTSQADKRLNYLTRKTELDVLEDKLEREYGVTPSNKGK